MARRVCTLLSLFATAIIYTQTASVASANSAAQHCPGYTDSDIYRQRQNQILVGPNDDWQAIITGAAPNTEVLLRDGEYRLTRYAVVMDNNNVTVRGASGDRDAVRIVGQGYGPGSEGFMVFGTDITIADLTMSAIRNHAISIKPEGGAARTHIYNTHIFNVGTQHIKGAGGAENVDGLVACSSIGYTPGGVQGDYLGAIDIHYAVNWTVRDNYIYNINGDGSGCEVDIDCGAYPYGAPSIYLWQNARGSIVERNTIVDSDRGIALGLGTGHDGGVIRNNFIYRPVAGDAGIELWTASNLLVEHNTVILGGSYPGAIEFRSASNITVRNNLVSQQPWDRGGNSGIRVEGNIADATVNDLNAPADPHLRVGSRAIGAGVQSGLGTDIDGDARNGRWDVGADQYANGGTADPVISMSGGSVTEADGIAQIRLSLNKPVALTSSPVRVLVFTQGRLGTATPGSDFWGFTRAVEINPGESEATVDVTILNNDIAEATETIRLRAIAVQNVELASSPLMATVTVLDDD